MFICNTSNFRRDRAILWDELRQNRELFGDWNLPWNLLGDYNVTLASNESSRVLEGLGDQNGMSDFQSMVSDCELTDLGYTGPEFTWSNRRSADPIGKKLDRALVNERWLETHPNSYATFETNGISDHLRCIVRLGNLEQGKRRHFQFFNFLVEDTRFHETVADYWERTEPLFHSRTALHRFNKKLKYLKPLLRALNREKYGDIVKKTKEAFDLLCNCQQQSHLNPNSNNFAAEASAMEEWQKLVSVEEQFFKQKSRIHWLKHGDKNTRFYHRMVQIRRARNSIKRVISETGEAVTGLTGIKRIAVEYYKEFFQKTNPESHLEVEDLNRLIQYNCSEVRAEQLVREVTEEEIKQALSSLPASKTPGPDGYTKEFFVAAWSLLDMTL